jgi:hypothetical protein
MPTPSDFWDKCPICRARVKDSAECGRCGLEFGPLLAAAEEARQLTGLAHAALRRQQTEKAHLYALRAIRIHATEETLKCLALTALASHNFSLALELWQRIKEGSS